MHFIAKRPYLVLIGDQINVESDDFRDSIEVTRVDDGTTFTLDSFWKKKREGNSYTGHLDTIALPPAEYMIPACRCGCGVGKQRIMVTETRKEAHGVDIGDYVDIIRFFAEREGEPASPEEMNKMKSIIPKYHAGIVIDTSSGAYECTQMMENLYRGTDITSIMIDETKYGERLKNILMNRANVDLKELQFIYPSEAEFTLKDVRFVFSKSSPVISVWWHTTIPSHSNTGIMRNLAIHQYAYSMCGYRRAVKKEITAFIEQTMEIIRVSGKKEPHTWMVRDLMVPKDEHMQFVRVSNSYPHDWYNDEVQPTPQFSGASTVLNKVWSFFSVATNQNFSVNRGTLTRYNGDKIYAKNMNIYPQSLFKRTRLMIMTTGEYKMVPCQPA